MTNNCVLADSSFWVALRSVKDVHHLAAKALATRMMRERCRLVVTPLIFAEVHARFSRMFLLKEMVIKDFWKNPVVIMEHLTHDDLQESISLLQSNQDKDYPFCDATSFVLMERLRIGRALSYDHHFTQYGQITVLQ